jgi:hypothetical protein
MLESTNMLMCIDVLVYNYNYYTGVVRHHIRGVPRVRDTRSHTHVNVFAYIIVYLH